MEKENQRQDQGEINALVEQAMRDKSDYRQRYHKYRNLKSLNDKEQAKKCFEDNGITFMFAPKYHKAMKDVANVRKSIKTRTIFNVLGPLSNPANASFQILGVYEKKLVLPIAKVIQDLGVKRALVVHSEDGLDEISCEKNTYIVEVNKDKISEYKEKSLHTQVSPGPAEKAWAGPGATYWEGFEDRLVGLKSKGGGLLTRIFVIT